MAWKSKRGKWDWRKFLTPAEVAFVAVADAEAAKIERQRAAWDAKFAHKRMIIVNRAIHRAKYDALAN